MTHGRRLRVGTADRIVAARPGIRPWAGRTSVARASLAASAPTIEQSPRGSFFWPRVTQQVASAARAFPFRDVSAAAAGAGAFALWVLALSLILG